MTGATFNPAFNRLPFDNSFLSGLRKSKYSSQGPGGLLGVMLPNQGCDSTSHANEPTALWFRCCWFRAYRLYLIFSRPPSTSRSRGSSSTLLQHILYHTRWANRKMTRLWSSIFRSSVRWCWMALHYTTHCIKRCVAPATNPFIHLLPCCHVWLFRLCAFFFFFFSHRTPSPPIVGR